MEEPEENINTNVEVKEPSVLSDDPNERKLARRLRIQRRLEEAARVQAIKDGTYKEPEPEKQPIDQAIEDSEDVLENLFLEGKELVSNVMVASDAREVERREAEVEDRNKRLKMLEDEAAVALQKLNEITNRWEMIQDVNDPLNLHEHMREQKAKCLDLIQQKNDLIKNFQLELKFADEHYMKDRRKMYEDLALLTQRIDEQVLVMKKAFRLELKNIEDVIDTTRSNIMEEHQKTWESLYTQRENEEVANMTRKFKMVETHEKDIDEIHKDHEEKYRETRIKLETDIQILEQELERVKALCLLNSEKLDYNYQVLKKREEENIYIKNHQKRKLNKLQDIVNTLKKKIEEKHKGTDSELKRLHQDVLRYHRNVSDLEKKAERFSHLNEETYQSIWEMKDQEAKEMLHKILQCDKVIHEQILGLPWTEPETKLLVKTDLPSYKTARRTINDLMAKPVQSKPKIDLGGGDMSDVRKSEYEEGHKHLLKQILEMVADQAGFLVEEKVDELLKPYTSEEKTLVRLDNVFTAIGIQTEKDINLMKEVFLPYAVCPLCENRKQSVPSVVVDSQSVKTQDNVESYHTESQGPELDDKITHLIMRGSAESIDGSSKIAEATVQVEQKPSIDPVQFLQKNAESSRDPAFICNITHPLMIEKIYVLYALKDFVAEFHADKCRAPVGISKRLTNQRTTISRLMISDDVKKYWERFKLVFPPEREKLWDVLFIGMNQYYSILKDRHKLNMKANKVRQQNLELRKLLERYVSFDKPDSRTNLVLPQLTRVDKNIIDMLNLREITAKIKGNF